MWTVAPESKFDVFDINLPVKAIAFSDSCKLWHESAIPRSTPTYSTKCVSV